MAHFWGKYVGFVVVFACWFCIRAGMAGQVSILRYPPAGITQFRQLPNHPCLHVEPNQISTSKDFL